MTDVKLPLSPKTGAAGGGTESSGAAGNSASDDLNLSFAKRSFTRGCGKDLWTGGDVNPKPLTLNPKSSKR